MLQFSIIKEKQETKRATQYVKAIQWICDTLTSRYIYRSTADDNTINVLRMLMITMCYCTLPTSRHWPPVQAMIVPLQHKSLQGKNKCRQYTSSIIHLLDTLNDNLLTRYFIYFIVLLPSLCRLYTLFTYFIELLSTLCTLWFISYLLYI